jgi:hypothetical protein
MGGLPFREKVRMIVSLANAALEIVAELEKLEANNNVL